MKTYQNPQPQADERAVKKQKKEKHLTKKQEDKKLDESLEDTFPASDPTAEY